MLLVLVLVLSSIKMGCCMACVDEVAAVRPGGDTGAGLLADARDEEAMIGGGDSSVLSFMLSDVWCC